MAAEAPLLGPDERLVVVDDDPTGSQTVAGVPLLLRFDDADLRWALGQRSAIVFALTNSRAGTEAEAVEVNERLGEAIQTLTGELGLTPRLLSRGDSTLRGHFPAEVVALDAGMRRAGAAPLDATLLCPAYVEAGRVSVGDIHYLERDGSRIPVAETEFARDPVFGFDTSNLRRWAAGRLARAALPSEVASVPLETIRAGVEPTRRELLGQAVGGRTVVLNAERRDDLDVLARAVAAVERDGRRFVYRTAPSFVAARAGRPVPTPIGGSAGRGPGLVVVGSHTELTTAQLAQAVESRGLRVVELATGDLIASSRRRAAAVRRAVDECVSGLARADVSLVTSRAEERSSGPGDAVATKAAIAAGIVAAVRAIVARRMPSFVLAKGGITSHDIARKALGAGRATVLGQLFEGQVAAWRLEDGALGAEAPYVVFPGNVGRADSLTRALDRVAGAPA